MQINIMNLSDNLVIHCLHNELVRQSCNTLSDYWLNGNPSDYLEGLDTDLRNCLICVLATDISADAIADMGLIEV